MWEIRQHEEGIDGALRPSCGGQWRIVSRAVFVVEPVSVAPELLRCGVSTFRAAG